MQGQLDLVFFVNGLAFLLLGFICAGLWRQEKAAPAWKWLALFGLVHGLNEWVDLLALGLGDSPWFASTRVLVLGASFAFLLEFARASTGVRGNKPRGGWVLVALPTLAALGVWSGLPGLQATVRYTLGLTGGIWAAVALLRAARREPKHDALTVPTPGARASTPAPVRREPKNGALTLAAAAVMCYALAAGAIVPKAPFWPASLLNYDSFLHATGIPIQLLRGGLACTVAAALWWHYETSSVAPKHSRRGTAVVLASMLVAVVACGWYGVTWAGEREQLHQDAQIRAYAQRAASGVALERIECLSASDADLASPDYRQLKKQLQALRATMQEVRFIYVMRRVEGRVVILVDSETPGSKDESPPGQVYDEASAHLIGAFDSGDLLVTPQSDRWGQWHSGIYALHDARTGAIVAILRVDQDARDFDAHVAAERLKIIGIAALCLVPVLLGFVYHRRWQATQTRAKTGVAADPLLRWGLAAIVWMVAGGLTLEAFLEIRRHNIASFATIFQQRAASRVQAAADALEHSLDGLDDLHHLCIALPDLTHHDFARCVELHKGMMLAHTVTWVPRISQDQRAAFEASAREEDLGGGQITVIDASGRFVPAPQCAEYYAVQYVEPLEEHRTILGFDLSSDPARRAALEAARDDGRSRATPPVRLVNKPVDPLQMLVLLPVYTGGATPATVEERRQKLRGFVVGVYRTDALARNMVTRQPGEGLAFLVEDAAAPPDSRITHRAWARLTGINRDQFPYALRCPCKSRGAPGR
jgi:CHASE1-domain containing sensor protein